MQPGKGVQVEPRERHDGVICVALVGDEEVGDTVPDEAEVVEGTEDGFHVGGGCGEEWDVLEIGVVFGHIGDEMVDVVRGLPPSD